jgi:hypothetical protein
MRDASGRGSSDGEAEIERVVRRWLAARREKTPPFARDDSVYLRINDKQRIKKSFKLQGTLSVFIDGQSTAVLSGSVGALVLEYTNGQSVLDCSGLQAGVIVSAGLIDGQCLVRLNSLSSITYREKIDGQCLIVASAQDTVIGNSLRGETSYYYRGSKPKFGYVQPGTLIKSY